MKTQIKVKITKRHIREGRPGDSTMCAIALALSEVCGDKKLDVNVEEADIQFGRVRVPTPTYATKFIKRFDACEKPEDDQSGPDFKLALKQYKKNFAKLKPFVLTLNVPLCELLAEDE